MEAIQAYRCDFCDKIYANPATCKAHERKCYYNPSTRSCASCTFLILESRPVEPNSSSIYQVCLKEIDISSGKLKTKCALHVEKPDDDIEDDNDPRLMTGDYTQIR